MPVETYNALRTEIRRAVSTASGSTTLEQLLGQRLSPKGASSKANVDTWKDSASRLAWRHSAQLDARQPVAALTGLRTDTVTVPDKKTATAALSAEDIAAARLLGKTEAEFLKMKEEMQ